MASRTLRIILIVSLTLNIFVIGGLAGAAIMWQRVETQRPLAGIGLPARLRQAAEALSPENRRMLRQSVRAAAQSLRPNIQEARAARIEAGRLLIQPTLNRSALDAALARARAADLVIRTRLETTVIDAAASLPLSEREALVDALDRTAARPRCVSRAKPVGAPPAAEGEISLPATDSSVRRVEATKGIRSMSATAIALNRFGLGARPDQAAPALPKAWLLDQFDRFEPRPAAIAALPTTSTIAGNLSDYLQMQRDNLRQNRGATSDQLQPTSRRRRAAGYAAPQMADQDIPTDGAAMSPMQASGQAGAAIPAERYDPVAQAHRFARGQARSYYMDAVAARSQVALTSPAPFAERLVHFWSNHFTVSIDKLTVIGLAGPLEFDAIRPHLTGRFVDMLQAVERHPAMLLYLDQAVSIGPDSIAGQLAAHRQQRRNVGLNENLAREILELHTLGVRTGYGQGDVTEFARALTGWTVAGLGRGAVARFAGVDGEPGRFVFAERLHEPGTRTLLGRSFTQAGESQAAAVLDILATHPATARHVATKLARHFAGDEPPAPLVARLEASFLKTGGDLPSLYRVLVEAPECWVEQPVKFKTPWEWSIGAMRALGTRELQPQAATGLLAQLGQPTWRPGSPAGWDDLAASWAGPDAIMRRVEAAERMAGHTNDTIDARARAVQLFPNALSEATAQAIARAESPSQGLALLLVAPESMRR